MYISAELAIESIIEQSLAGTDEEKCINNAPPICVSADGHVYKIVRGQCHSWQCPRCGNLRAYHEYARIMNGLEHETELYFLTVTCRGDVTLEVAEQEYQTWCNRLLTTLRKDARKRDVRWLHVGVIERQQRGHPHTHMITTYAPMDVRPYRRGQYMPGGKRARAGSLHSEYLRERVVSAGLGQQTDLTVIRNPRAVAMYISKYLFKSAQDTAFPKRWKRIRYSQSFPKMERNPAPVVCFPVIGGEGWFHVRTISGMVVTENWTVYGEAIRNGATNVLWQSGAKP